MNLTSDQGRGFFRSVARGSAAGALLHVSHYAIRFLLTPFVIVTVGLEAYGYWAILFQFLGLVGLHRIGLPAATVPLVARLRSERRLDAITRQVQTTAVVMAGLAVLIVTLSLLLAPRIVGLLGADDAFSGEAVRALQVTAVATAIALVLGGYQTALEGLERHASVRLIEGAACLVEAAVIVVLLNLGVGLTGLAYAYALRVLLPLPFFALVAGRALPGLNALPLRFDRELLKPVLSFGGSLQLFGFLHLFVATVDRMVLAHGVSLLAAGAFELARKLVSLGASLPLQVCAPLTAAFAGQPAELQQLSHRTRTSLRLLVVLSAPILGLLAFAPEAVLCAWVEVPPEGAALTLRLFAISGFLHIATGPLTAYLRSRANGSVELQYMLLWSVAAVLLVPGGCLLGGMAGAVAGSAVSQVLGAAWLFARGRKVVGLRAGRTLADLLLPIACALPGGLWMSLDLPVLEDRRSALVALAPRAVLFTASTWGLWAAVALDARERSRARRALFRALSRLLVLPELKRIKRA